MSNSFEQKKAEALMRTLKENLQYRFPTYTLTDGLDSNANPTLLISQSSTPAVGEDNMLLRIMPISYDAGQVDALGIAQRVYAPHILQLLEQKDDTTHVTTTAGSVQKVIWEESKMALALEIWVQNDATNAVVSASQIDSGSATLLSSLSDLFNPKIGEV